MRGRGDIFTDVTKLREMLSLREQGIGPSELGRKYGVDHTTIIYHCKRNGLIMPRGAMITVSSSGVSVAAHMTVRTVGISVASGVPRVILDGHDNTPICAGHNYAEYMASKQKQREQYFLSKTVQTTTQ